MHSDGHCIDRLSNAPPGASEPGTDGINSGFVVRVETGATCAGFVLLGFFRSTEDSAKSTTKRGIELC